MNRWTKSTVSRVLFVSICACSSFLPYVEAIRECFYNGEEDKLDGFWRFEGKVIRGNRRRRLIHGRTKRKFFLFIMLPLPIRQRLF